MNKHANKPYASNYGYNISHKVLTTLKNGQQLTGAELLPYTDNSRQDELLEMVCAIANKRRAMQPADEAQIEETRCFIAENIQSMTTEFLDRAEQVAIASGLFTLACAIRWQNEELVISSSDNRGFLTRQNAVKLLWCYVNRRDYQAAEDIKCGFLTTRHLHRLRFVLGLSQDAAIYAKNKTENRKYSDFIKNKNIAIVGPSSSGADCSAEIERDFDIIIRMKYRGRETLPEAQRHLTPQITYFRDTAGPWDASMAGAEGNVDYLKELDFAVLIKRTEKVRKRMLSYTCARTVNLLECFYFSHAKHNLLQHIVHDLSYYSPARVKVFYANLYLTETRHDTGYKPPAYSRGTLDFWYDYAKHNVICQYNYLRHIYKQGLIEADGRLSEILELGAAGYVKELQVQEDKKILH